MESVFVDSSACSGSHLSYSGVGLQLPRKLPRSPRLDGCFGTTYLDTSRECRRKSRVEENTDCSVSFTEPAGPASGKLINRGFANGTVPTLFIKSELHLFGYRPYVLALASLSKSAIGSGDLCEFSMSVLAMDASFCTSCGL